MTSRLRCLHCDTPCTPALMVGQFAVCFACRERHYPNEIRRQILKEVLDQAETMSGYELVRWLRQEMDHG